MTNRKIINLSQPLKELKIVCNRRVKGGKLAVVTKMYGEKEYGIDRDLEDSKIEELKELYKNHPDEFISFLIENNMNLISSFIGGQSLELPMGILTKDKYLCVKSGDFNIYFNELACKKYKDIVMKLDKKSKKDCFKIAEQNIGFRYCSNLKININYNSALLKDSRIVSVEKKDWQKHSRSMCYEYIGVNKEFIATDDLLNIFKLIDLHSSLHGEVQQFEQKVNGLRVMYNNGYTMLVNGVNSESPIFNKVYQKIISR